MDLFILGKFTKLVLVVAGEMSEDRLFVDVLKLLAMQFIFDLGRFQVCKTVVQRRLEYLNIVFFPSTILFIDFLQLHIRVELLL